MKTLLRIIRIIKSVLKGEEKKLEAQTMYIIYMPGERLPYDPESIIDVECEIM